jgi:hypothetical protein
MQGKKLSYQPLYAIFCFETLLRALGAKLIETAMSPLEAVTLVTELEREIADLRRHNEQLRETIAALLAPPPPNDKERLWQETHPRAQ